MTDIRQDEITGIHKVPLYGALGVVVLSIVLICFAVVTGKGQVGRTIGKPAVERAISFRTNATGEFSVLDAETAETLGSFGTGAGAFIRMSVRSMTLNRTSKGIPYDLPYRLVRTADGKMSFIDPETGHFIKLNAFGSVAMTSFSQFLPNPSENGA